MICFILQKFSNISLSLRFCWLNAGLLLQNRGNSNKVLQEGKKKGKGRYLVLQSLISVCLLFSVGEGLERLCGRRYQKKKKKPHQLRIWLPPLKLYLNNMFLLWLKPSSHPTSLQESTTHLPSWALWWHLLYNELQYCLNKGNILILV